MSTKCSMQFCGRNSPWAGLLLERKNLWTVWRGRSLPLIYVRTCVQPGDCHCRQSHASSGAPSGSTVSFADAIWRPCATCARVGTTEITTVPIDNQENGTDTNRAWYSHLLPARRPSLRVAPPKYDPG